MLPKTKSKPKHTLSDLTALVYGPSKIGKSTWCSKADDALFLATEPGLNALEVFQTPITCWDDLLQACAEIAELVWLDPTCPDHLRIAPLSATKILPAFIAWRAGQRLAAAS